VKSKFTKKLQAAKPSDVMLAAVCFDTNKFKLNGNKPRATRVLPTTATVQQVPISHALFYDILQVRVNFELAGISTDRQH
jgi:hypothetical protein